MASRYQLSALCFLLVVTCELHAIFVDTLGYTEPSFFFTSQLAIAPTLILMIYTLTVAQVEYWRSFNSLIGPLMVMTFTVVNVIQLSGTFESAKVFLCMRYFVVAKSLTKPPTAIAVGGVITSSPAVEPIASAWYYYNEPLCQIYPVWNSSALLVVGLYLCIAWYMFEDDRRQIVVMRLRATQRNGIIEV
jgi:hypothetical protein